MLLNVKLPCFGALIHAQGRYRKRFYNSAHSGKLGTHTHTYETPAYALVSHIFGPSEAQEIGSLVRKHPRLSYLPVDLVSLCCGVTVKYSTAERISSALIC